MARLTFVGNVTYGDIAYRVSLIDGGKGEYCLLCSKAIRKSDLAIRLSVIAISRAQGPIAHVRCAKGQWRTVYALVVQNVDCYPAYRTRLVFEAAS
jgi:hypothetical protein